MIQDRSIVVFIDGLAAGFVFEDARVYLFSKAEGYPELALKLHRKEISVRGYKLIVVLLGRADVWDTDRKFFEAVDKVVKEIYNQNEKAIIVLGASLPLIADSKTMVNTFVFRNDKFAARSPRLEHARPGKQLLGQGGPIADYYDEYGNLNELGSDVISRALERKIFSAKIFQRAEEQ